MIIKHGFWQTVSTKVESGLRTIVKLKRSPYHSICSKSILTAHEFRKGPAFDKGL